MIALKVTALEVGHQVAVRQGSGFRHQPPLARQQGMIDAKVDRSHPVLEVHFSHSHPHFKEVWPMSIVA